MKLSSVERFFDVVFFWSTGVLGEFREGSL
jgi:hypothetical protein